jgi:hypothetical protein
MTLEQAIEYALQEVLVLLNEGCCESIFASRRGSFGS